MTISQIFTARVRTLFSTFVKLFAAAAVTFTLFASPSAAAKNVEKPAVSHSKVNLNSANAAMLADVLSGVGLKKAQAIVEWRKEHGKFKTIDQLLLVKGIGDATLDKNRSKLTL